MEEDTHLCQGHNPRLWTVYLTSDLKSRLRRGTGSKVTSYPHTNHDLHWLTCTHFLLLGRHKMKFIYFLRELLPYKMKKITEMSCLNIGHLLIKLYCPFVKFIYFVEFSYWLKKNPLTLKSMTFIILPQTYGLIISKISP